MTKIVIMPGGFHPFHAGHKALYDQAVVKFPDADIYVAASDNQKDRPFPFKVKEKLASVAGVPAGKFRQVKSPFRPAEITDHYDENKDVLIFVRSDKDRSEQPKPGGIKKDGSPAYYQPYDEKNLRPFKERGYIDYLDTVEFADGITSATEIRNAWPKLDELGKIELIKGMYPGSELNVPALKNLVQMLDTVLIGELTEGDVVAFKRPDLPENIQQLVIDWYGDQNRYTKAQLQSKGYKVAVDDHSTNIVVTDKKGREFTVSVDKAMDSLIQQAYREPEQIDETFVDPDESKQYWNHDDENVGVGMEIEMPLTDTPNLNGRRQGFNEGEERSIIRDAAINALVNAFEGHEDEFESREAIEANIYSVLSDLDVEDIVDPEMDHHGQRMGNFASGRVIDVVDSSSVIDEVMQQINYFDPADDRNYVSESLNKIRGMIKETTDEQKSKSVDLHRKLFELFEEEKDNVVQLRGFRKETDKKVVDINKVRQEKQANQERENNYYSERRAEQDDLLARLQSQLLNAKQEFSELADAKLLPIEMLDTMESITKLIDYIENWSGSKDQNDFPFTESILEKLQLKTVQLKEYFGGMRDRSAPRVLRKQEPKSSPKDFWNKIDLSETADYIEEK